MKKFVFKIIFLLILCLNTLQAQNTNFEGYLFAYFEGAAENRKDEEQLRFAISEDAINWTALNNNQPILNSDDISQSGGIRDPQILRGEDEDSYYIVATDMSTASNG